MTDTRKITLEDVLPVERFEEERAKHREALAAAKRNRRVEVGPFAAFYFENYATMWWQVHEMLRIERGGDAQIQDELDAYNPLIPQGRELVATFMIEIEDPARRARELARLGGIENAVSFRLDGEIVRAVPADDAERSTPEGKASSVHFLRFPFTEEQIAKFRDPKVEVLLAIDHPDYAHRAVVAHAVRAALAEDFAA